MGADPLPNPLPHHARPTGTTPLTSANVIHAGKISARTSFGTKRWPVQVRPTTTAGHRPDPAQRARLAEIRDNRIASITKAEREGWLGEVEGHLVQRRIPYEENGPADASYGGLPHAARVVARHRGLEVRESLPEWVGKRGGFRGRDRAATSTGDCGGAGGAARAHPRGRKGALGLRA